MNLDSKDRLLLALLEKDCRLSNADLAEKMGMSTSACWRRIRAFEEAGLIVGYGARLQSEKLGLTFHAIVHVQLTRHDPANLKRFIEAVNAREEIRMCFATTGSADYHMRVRCTDIEAYNRFLEDFLFMLPAVSSAQTNVILRDLKS
ncbi:Lrp/AsnC family transcriptional regulator [Shimia sagamensis]|uniref:DNA-binding transcriptional regulator, Lrp family n=1 Tax=Shimia sagamensis TaxID=1566352 RepID=A0ABY1PJS2_9RHOB|nr:Lrp/AsnC family transcriptional regulator [Shimia sagamensis]SMP35811.1 DNA-binding transcriptional regulator, Lrp family [Shimia sagamensis]